MAFPQWWLRLRLWSRRSGLAGKLAVALTLGAITSGVATYVALTNTGLPGAPDPTTVLNLLVLDLVLLLMLGALVARRLVLVWMERRGGSAGSRLHVRLVMVFSLIAVAPAILVAIFSALFFNVGVQAWFSDRVRTALGASLEVAHAYLEEHQQIIGGDALAMANDLNRAGPGVVGSRQRLNQLVATQAAIRGLTESLVFSTGGAVVARWGMAFSLEMSIDQIPAWAFERARSGEVAVLPTENDNRVRALVQLEGALAGNFLYVGRFVDPKVIAHMERTSQAVEEYNRLEGRRSGLEITLTMIFGVVALLLLLAAVWVGLAMATQLARPISRLIDAADRVRAGDLSARVDESGSDEIGSLSRAFNRMTSQLEGQRRDLVGANRELDQRRRFTEAVLAGVSAGVIGLDAAGRINLPNRSASELLGVDLERHRGEPLAGVVPEFAEELAAVERRPDRLVQAEVKLLREGRTRILLCRLAAERMGGEVVGYVLTFDDITELLAAQRKAAWADVARRIAHEIKNPLTPIQLSAERLKRKYLKEIGSDPETFVACTDTIIRQVGDIGRMVDEFSDFARMPAPVMRQDDLGEVVRQTVFLQQHGYPGIRFDTRLPEAPVSLVFDARQIGQALANLLKNAVESILGREAPDAPPGQVVTTLMRRGDGIVVAVEDNGRGLPRELGDRLTEPYVTTRAKGTGLGLAIVKKIMEDHGGDLRLEDLDGSGARVELVFRVNETAPMKPPSQAAAEHGA